MTTKNILTGLGVIFITLGLFGAAATAVVMGMHLSVAHNLVHLISGALALYFGLKGTPAGAKNFSLLFGAVYALLGAAGFAAGIGPDRMFVVIPDQLILGTVDHAVHLILGAVFLIVGLYKKPMTTAAQEL